MLGEHLLPQSEVTRAIVLEDSPCCGVPHLAALQPPPALVAPPPPFTVACSHISQPRPARADRSQHVPGFLSVS